MSSYRGNCKVTEMLIEERWTACTRGGDVVRYFLYAWYSSYAIQSMVKESRYVMYTWPRCRKVSPACAV